MLNLGIINSGGSYQDVSLEEVQASQLAYMEAEQRLTDYMNYVEVLEGLQRHSSTECLAFASELLGVAESDIRGMSNENFAERISQEGLGVWGTFKKLWNDFVRWITNLWNKIINFFKGKKGSATTGSGSATAPASKGEAAGKAATTTKSEAAGKTAKAATPAKASSSDKPQPRTYAAAPKPQSYNYVVRQKHSDQSIKAYGDAAEAVSKNVRLWKNGRYDEKYFENSVTTLMKHAAAFKKESGNNMLTGEEAVSAYIRKLRQLLGSLNSTVEIVDKLSPVHPASGRQQPILERIKQRVRAFNMAFVGAITKEFKAAEDAFDKETKKKINPWAEYDKKKPDLSYTRPQTYV